MSGPTSVFLFGDPVTALLSAAGIRAAEALYEGYAQAEALRAEHASLRDADRAVQGAAHRQGRAALEAETLAAEARIDQLIQLAARLGADARVRATRPARPAGEDFITLAAYTHALRTLADELQAILLTEAARVAAESDEGPAALVAPATAAAATAPVRASQRLLERIAHLGPPPADIAALALELDGTPPGERARLLGTELRLRIQAHLESVQQRLVQEATATIVRQSLKDLGYEVEELADTLFVEGGIVHFRKAGWGEYMVRMRVEAKGAAANFNVIRATAPGDNAVSVLDHIAEDRWCAEFPALLKALEIRGVHMQVRRRLEAGEVPVQRVDRDKLPRFADEEAAAPENRPLARELRG